MKTKAIMSPKFIDRTAKIIVAMRSTCIDGVDAEVLEALEEILQAAYDSGFDAGYDIGYDTCYATESNSAV